MQFSVGIISLEIATVHAGGKGVRESLNDDGCTGTDAILSALGAAIKEMITKGRNPM